MSGWKRAVAAFTLLFGAAILASSLAVSPHTLAQTISIRGHAQHLYIYGRATGDPVIVSSGDGGWMHLGPDVAAFLAEHGFYVIGFDVKAYLETFSGSGRSLNARDEPGDYRVLIDAVTHTTGKRPILVGVSEGAGLSVLAASEPVVKSRILGVIGLGVPVMTELAWRWQDDVIYVTHKAPNEPSFRTSTILPKLAPVPFAAIHSTHDEFVPGPEIAAIVGQAGEPKRLWMVNAANHRFAGNTREFNERLLEAVRWVNERADPLESID